MNNKVFYNKLSDKKKKQIDDYLKKLEDSLFLTYKDTKLFVNDFENAIIYYYNKGKSLDEIFKILSLDNIGECYKESATHWYALDNSAKIYPLSMKENWMSVFRISYYLKEDVVPELLQVALNYTMKRFPTFRTSVRKGFFWHYFDGIKRRFKVRREMKLPCAYINVSNIGKQSFKILYYKNRISTEMFHILADGYGGIVFLSTLVTEYLRLCGKRVEYNNLALNVNEKYKAEEVSDEFLKRTKSKKSRSLNESKALNIDGKLSDVKPCQLLHFDMSVDELKAASKKRGVTITNLMLGFVFMAIYHNTSKDGYIRVQVPVNMRNYYESNTLRNFSLYVIISIKRSDITDFESLLMEIKKQMEEKITKEYFDETMTYTNKLVKSLKFIPLFIKRPIAKIVYGYLGDKVLTTVLSNLGDIKIPEANKKYIEKMDVALGTGLTNRALFSMISCNGIATLTIAKSTTNSSIENIMYNLIRDENINVNVSGSDIYEN